MRKWLGKALLLCLGLPAFGLSSAEAAGPSVNIGTRRNQNVSAIDSVYLFGRFSDSLVVKARASDSVRVLIYKGQVIIDSAKFAWAAVSLANTNSYDRTGAFLITRRASDGNEGPYYADVHIYTGTQTSQNIKENWNFYWNVFADQKFDTTLAVTGEVRVNSIDTLARVTNLTTNDDKTGYTLTAADKSQLADSLENRIPLFLDIPLNKALDGGFEGRPLGAVWKKTNDTANIVTNGSILSGRRVLRLQGAGAKVVSDSFAVANETRLNFGGQILTSNPSGAEIRLENTSGTVLATCLLHPIMVNLWQGVEQEYRNTTGGTVLVRIALINGPSPGDTSRLDQIFLMPLSDSIGAGAILSNADMDKLADNVLERKRGTVTGGASPTSFRSTALTETDNYWNENQVQFLNGLAAGQVARITAFTAAADSVTFAPAASIAPAVGDSFAIIAILGEAPSVAIDSVRAVGSVGRIGSGPYVSTIVVADSGSNPRTVVAGAVVALRDSATGTPWSQTVTTGSDGVASFGTIGAKAYYARFSKQFYRKAANTDTLVQVAAVNTIDSMFVVGVTLGPPPSGGQVTIEGFVYDVRGDSVEGATVTFTLNQPCWWPSTDTANLVMVAQERSVTTNVNGKFSIPVYPTDNLLGSDRRNPARYSVTVTLPDGTISYTDFVITIAASPTTQKFAPNLYRWKTE